MRGRNCSNPSREPRPTTMPRPFGSVPPSEAHWRWQPEETARFLEHVKDDRLSVLYELAAYAGLRRADLCGLRWADIDRDGAGLTVRQTVIEVSDYVPVGGLICAMFAKPNTLAGISSDRSPGRVAVGCRWSLPRRSLWRGTAPNKRGNAGSGTDYNDHDLVFCDIAGNPLRPWRCHGGVRVTPRRVRSSGRPTP